MKSPTTLSMSLLAVCLLARIGGARADSTGTAGMSLKWQNGNGKHSGHSSNRESYEYAQRNR